MIETAIKSLIYQSNGEAGDSLDNSFCQGASAILLQQINETRETNKGDLIITIFEWQNYITALFGYGREEVSKLLSHIDDLLRSQFQYLSVRYIDVGKISVITPYSDIKKHKQDLDNFFEECLKISALLSPTPIYVDFKIGYTHVKNDAKDAVDEVLIALAEAKLSPAHHNVGYNEGLAAIKERYNQVELVSYFLEALQNKRLRLGFQPIVCAKTGKVECYEALLRILTKEGHIISAGIFIPAAEKLGLISNIDLFVLKAVVRELTLDKKVRISMNISSLVIRDKRWYEEAKALLKDRDIASRLIIEITETGGENDLITISKFVESIQALGCGVAIDDFGAGYTSFKQLKLLSADILKIDGAFVRDIVENPESKLFINIMLQFAKAYNLKTVAEFVETGEIAKTLMDLGVDYLQGFYFSQALNYRPWIKDDAII
jgi:EAL domain-containing protein (putative c-di-GMP-specific phosphodiesterase class I)